MSLTKTNTNLSIYGLRKLFIKHINVDGAFVSPKNIEAILSLESYATMCFDNMTNNEKQKVDQRLLFSIFKIAR